MKKVTIVGAGNVGATAASYLAEKNIAHIHLIDVVAGVPEGKALDTAHASPVRRYDFEVTGSSDFTTMRDSDVVVVTAGMPRKPGMSRDDLVRVNAEIVRNVSVHIAECCPNATVIVVTNPLDVMTYLCLKATGFAVKRVMGMAGVLDSTRFRLFIAQELNVSVSDTMAMVLGSHGDSMVPLPRYSTVHGIPITELMSPEAVDRLVKRTANGGAEIVSLLKTGSAFYAPAASVIEMVEAVVRDKKRILPVSAYLRGEYGLKDVTIGVPALVGANGVEKIVQIDLTETELAMLHKSAGEVRAVIDRLPDLF